MWTLPNQLPFKHAGHLASGNTNTIICPQKILCWKITIQQFNMTFSSLFENGAAFWLLIDYPEEVWHAFL